MIIRLLFMLLWAVVISWLVISFYILVAKADEPDAAWFRSLKQPLTGATCCDISDCRMTKAKWDKDHWIAIAPDATGVNAWVPVPNEKILRNKQSPNGEAYLCSGYARQVYCFIPPNLGY